MSHGKPTPNGNLLIVDGLNLAFRWKHQGNLDFEYDYVRTVQSLAKSYNCGEIVVLGDGGSDYRKEIYPEYKANRKERYAEQTPEEEQEFLEFLQEFSLTMKQLKKRQGFNRSRPENQIWTAPDPKINYKNLRRA